MMAPRDVFDALKEAVAICIWLAVVAVWLAIALFFISALCGWTYC